MSVLEQDIQSQLQHLKSQLEQARLTQRNTSFKFKRELQVLQRVVTSLSSAYVSDNPKLQSALSELRLAIEKQTDISALIPNLLVLERLIKQHAVDMEVQRLDLNTQVKHAGETLLRVSGIPSKLKRDLRDLLSFCTTNNIGHTEQALKLLAIYERSVKILISNPDSGSSLLTSEADKALLQQLNSELQHLITELDFAGESGELLNDIRAKLLIGVNTQALLEETLHVLKLVIQGTHFERKTSQQFLAQVSESLNTSIKSSAQLADQSESYHVQRIEFGQELNALVTNGKSLVQQSQSLDELQQGLVPLFEDIATLNDRLKHTEERESALLERMKYQHCQLEALQESALDYRRRLEDQAERLQQDPLTRVFNRSAFNERLELEFRRWIRSQNSLRVVMFDIDNFRSLNDSFGYSAGDKALKIIARNIKAELSESDTLARFSGEEFIVLLPDRADPDSHELIKAIQYQISHLPFKFREQQISITASAVSTKFKDSDTPEEVLERLRLLLKEAKSLGAEQIIWK